MVALSLAVTEPIFRIFVHKLREGRCILGLFRRGWTGRHRAQRPMVGSYVMLGSAGSG